MSSPDSPVPGTRVVRRRPRGVSGERRWFLTAIRGQLAGARILGYVAIAVAIGAGAWWIIGTTGSPVVGAGFIALGAVLGAAIWSFAGLMRMIGGAPVSGRLPAVPPGVPVAPSAPPLPHPTRRTP